MRIVITVNPGTTIEHLERLQDYLADDLNIFVEDVGNLITDQMSFNFSSSPWPPLAASTLALKQAYGYPLDVLVRTGAMKDDATLSPWLVTEKGGDIVGEIDVPAYSEFHFEGTRFMPARDYAFLP